MRLIIPFFAAALFVGSLLQGGPYIRLSTGQEFTRDEYQQRLDDYNQEYLCGEHLRFVRTVVTRYGWVGLEMNEYDKRIARMVEDSCA